MPNMDVFQHLDNQKIDYYLPSFSRMFSCNPQLIRVIRDCSRVPSHWRLFTPRRVTAIP